MLVSKICSIYSGLLLTNVISPNRCKHSLQPITHKAAPSKKLMHCLRGQQIGQYILTLQEPSVCSPFFGRSNTCRLFRILWDDPNTAHSWSARNTILFTQNLHLAWCYAPFFSSLLSCNISIQCQHLISAYCTILHCPHYIRLNEIGQAF